MWDSIKNFLQKYNRALVITCLVMLFIEISALNVAKVVVSQRQNLSNLGAAIAKTIDPAEVAALTGQASDLDKSAYTNLKSRLEAVNDSNKDLRFIYIFGARDNEVIFLLDSESAENASKYGDNTAKPGDVYEEADDDVRAAFQGKELGIIGPGTDRWGTFMSVLTPIVDPSSGRVIAVLGVDMLYNNWLANLISLSLPPLIVGALFIVAYIVIGRVKAQEKKHRRELQLMKYAIDNAANPVIWINSSGLITYANFAAMKIFGRSLDEMETIYFWKLLVEAEGSKKFWQEQSRNAKKQGISSTYASFKDGKEENRVYRIDSTHIIFDNEDYYLVFAYDVNRYLDKHIDDKAVLDRKLIKRLDNAFKKAQTEG